MRRTKFFGLLRRCEAWRLSVRGWIVILFVLGTSGLLFLLYAHPFLALNQPVRAGALVVEGWINDYAIRAAVEEFHRGGYGRVFATGGPVPGSEHANIFNTYASVTAERLIARGIPREAVEIVPAPASGRDRTYSGALALKQRLASEGMSVASVNVLTETTHARRSRLLFRMALGKEVQVGVISIPNPEYEAARWWRYSEGVKGVISEAVAYCYAKFFFYPNQPPLARERTKSAPANGR